MTKYLVKFTKYLVYQHKVGFTNYCSILTKYLVKFTKYCSIQSKYLVKFTKYLVTLLPLVNANCVLNS